VLQKSAEKKSLPHDTRMVKSGLGGEASLLKNSKLRGISGEKVKQKPPSKISVNVGEFPRM